MTHSLPTPLPVDALPTKAVLADIPPTDVLQTDTPQSKSPWAGRTRELAVTLTGWPSVTGSPGETQFAPLLESLLRRWPTLRQEDVWLSPARHGHQAWNLYALVRGQQAATVLLAGHYDTVSTDDYGPLKPLAHDAEALTRQVRQTLQDSARQNSIQSGSERLAHLDLQSGDYLMGRGLLDMKGGLAAGLAVLERYAALPLAQRPGHLLLVATPDEEGRSSGARAVAHQLPEVAAKLGLKVVAGINLDATADVGSGETGRSVYLGTVGKLALSALVIGRPTHAAYPYDGLSASLIASTLVARVEAAPELADGWSERGGSGHSGPGNGEPQDGKVYDSETGELAAPPVCLELRDSRTHYDVTTPARMWCAFNVLTHGRAPGQVLEQFTSLARSAAQEALGVLARRATLAGSPNALPISLAQTEVLTLGDLRARAAQRAGQEAVKRLTDQHAPGADPLGASRELTTGLATLAGLEGPAVVVGFGSLYYPATQLGKGSADQRLLQSARRHAADLSQESGESIRLRRYFAGISDMSFFGQAAQVAETLTLQGHTPHPALVDPVPPDALEFPIINVGPWGRDYHQCLERIFMPYAFHTVPELLWRVIRSVLDDTPS